MASETHCIPLVFLLEWHQQSIEGLNWEQVYESVIYYIYVYLYFASQAAHTTHITNMQCVHISVQRSCTNLWEVCFCSLFTLMCVFVTRGDSVLLKTLGPKLVWSMKVAVYCSHSCSEYVRIEIIYTFWYEYRFCKSPME